MNNSISDKSREEQAEDIKTLALAVLDTEADSIRNLKPRVGNDFVRACRMILDCQGRVIVSGMGKSGHIGSKIAATLSSTGSSAFFVHPAEASHGDLGMIKSGDIFLAISKSGHSDELLTLLPVLKRLGISLIAMTGNPDSPLARQSDVNLDISVEKEACPMGLAPTASTSATLAFGDALAVAVLAQRNFSADDFALSHPGGSLGRKLLIRVADIMLTGDAIPCVSPHTPLSETLVEISRKSLGIAVVTDEQGQLLGLFTDGDLRRTIDRELEVRHTPVGSVMTRGGQSITPDALAVDAVDKMQNHKISVLPVVDADGQVCGILNMHMLLSAGVV